MTTPTPIFPNSIVSNDLDFIRPEDDNAFSFVVFTGTQRQEMPDKRHDRLFDDASWVFQASYADDVTIELWAHSDFQSTGDAMDSVGPVARAIGHLPHIMRATLNHVVIQKGDETAFGEAEGHFFVLYSDNIRTRIANADLEETVFHEAVHATLDARLLTDPAWRAAQAADGAFITDYAARLPEKEDLAESALFAWTLLRHPGRLPPEIESRARDIMPNRIAFFADLLRRQDLL